MSGTTVPVDGEAPASFDGDKVGRYLLLREIGRGSMGQVFAGFDPDLTRRVAVKLVTARGEQLAPFLLREARMLAALTHINVVPVFDVGLDAGRLYIVMELVDGTSLASWLEEQPRSPREILRAWCAAGRGLAAAHAAGVVHRDFKASNVLISKDGNVRVADFGLARGVDEEAPIEGTRGYMAPEQGVATAAGDQYAFCVSLYRALTGYYPTPDAPLPPRALRKLLARGLATNPEARWPSMAVLVDALVSAQQRPRRIAIAAAALGIVALGGATFVATRESGVATCDPADHIARTLPTRTRDRLAATMPDSPLKTRVEKLIADGLAAWVGAYDCRSPARTRCLDSQLDDLAMIVDDTITEHRDTFDVPIQLSTWIGKIGTCDSPGPPDYRHAMARALALSRLGRTQEAIASAQLAVDKATEPTAKLRAEVRRVAVEDEPSTEKFEALAARVKEPALVAEVAMAAAQACMGLGTTTCAQTWTDRLSDALAKLPVTEALELRADLVGLRGDLARRAGDPATAAAMFQDEVRRIEALYGPDSLALLPGLTALAGVLTDLKRTEEAVKVASRADGIVVRWLGEDHPHRTISLNELGVAKLKNGDAPGAIVSLERALALRVAQEGESSPKLANLYNNLAAIYHSEGQFARALALVDRSVALYARHPDLDGGRRLFTLRNGAMLASQVGRDDAPLRIAAAFMLADERIPADHPDRALLYQTRGIIEVRHHEFAAAITDLTESATRFERLGDRVKTDLAITYGYLALVALHEHKLDIAQRRLAAAAKLGAFPAGNIKGAFLTIVDADLALARGKLTTAREILAPITPILDADRKSQNPRLHAYHHLLLATLAARERDTGHAAAERTRAADALRSAEIPESVMYEECAACDRN